MPESSSPRITALVCTHNRGGSLTNTLKSILANTHPNFEVIVVDQSVNRDTSDAVIPFLTDARLRYIPQSGQGLGRARNLGIAEASGEIVVMTDDDCTVPPNWLDIMEGIFTDHPQVAVAFCNVSAGPHDPLTGFIPAYQRSGVKLVRTSLGKCAARGIGAGVAVRRASMLAMGGFDEMLGAGAHFPSCDDGDIAVRALLLGYSVFETDLVSVEHAGFRTWEEGRELARRDWVGIGAAYSKPLKSGYLRFTVVPLYELCRFALWPPIWDILRLRRPRGLGRIGAFFQGFVRGWRTPIDPQTLLFLPSDQRVLN